VTEVERPPLLAGRYELGERIGAGGMADVRRGVDVRLGREVAVKVLRADLARDPAFQARFRREAQAAASLSAPTIVSVFDTGEDPDGVPFIVMEFVAGRTLRDVLYDEGRLLPQRALEVAADICTALEVAHSAGIVHRDIKPGNVMLTPRGEIKVMDFGIARAAADTSAVTQTAAVIGTAAYLSPEQARGEHVDARSDLYSTGCLLYELLTGAPPFQGDSAVAVAYQHVREEPHPPSAYDDTLPPQVDAVVLKAMAKNPLHRYQSAQEMRDDLLRAGAGDDVAAPPVLVPVGAGLPFLPAAAHPPTRRSPRRGLAYALFGLVLLGLVAAVALLVRGLADTASTGLVPAPAVVGLDQREAVAVLASQGLRPGRVDEQFDDSEFGTVLAQSPDEGIVVPAGGTVDLVISKGIEMTVVPAEVIGLPRQEAEVLLADRKLEVGELVGRDGLYRAGTVLAVTPEPGRQVPAGSGVTLTVASGRVAVPDVRGQPRESAVDALQRAGFSVVVELRDDAGAPGRVLEQSPVGRVAEVASPITVVVSQEPPPPPPSPSPEPSPSPSAPEPTPTPTDAEPETPPEPSPAVVG
jgi:beta-lactam-binding protein with PASTA domain/tRNA A-37 threonylcarbamoyl transferase component Bud32